MYMRRPRFEAGTPHVGKRGGRGNPPRGFATAEARPPPRYIPRLSFLSYSSPRGGGGGGGHGRQRRLRRRLFACLPFLSRTLPFSSTWLVTYAGGWCNNPPNIRPASPQHPRRETARGVHRRRRHVRAAGGMRRHGEQGARRGHRRLRRPSADGLQVRAGQTGLCGWVCGVCVCGGGDVRPGRRPRFRLCAPHAPVFRRFACALAAHANPWARPCVPPTPPTFFSDKPL